MQPFIFTMNVREKDEKKKKKRFSIVIEFPVCFLKQNTFYKSDMNTTTSISALPPKLKN